jgi:hypothetical protein
MCKTVDDFGSAVSFQHITHPGVIAAGIWLTVKQGMI